MTFGIIGALDEEVRLIKERMQVDREVQTYGCTYYIGTYAGHGVVAVCCSVGTINAAVCASTVIREFGADVVVNVGIAGSLSKELRVMDVVVSDKVTFHDADLDIMEKFYPNQRMFHADEALRALCLGVLEAMTDRPFSYKVGLIATGNVFVNESARKEDIVRRLEPLCVEMEGASIGQVAYMNGKPFLVIRTMSDNADDEADDTYDNFMVRAAQVSAELILRMIAAYSK